MKSLYRYIAPPSPCAYLPAQQWSLEYELVGALTPAEYEQRLHRGWRRFGWLLFRPRCPACRACQSLRVVVERFQPNRSQRRAWRANVGRLRCTIGIPCLTEDKLALYDRYHAFQSQQKDWPQHSAGDADHYLEAFISNPFATEEWCYYRQDTLVGVGYVDVLASGLSAIYFFYEPEERRSSPGTWNILYLIEQARQRGLPYVYLGYYVADCPSLSYKANFRPNQVLGADGVWRDFRF
jgi:arginyl-tRNA--protein-N-Asp/Glu arginylyltransferase